MTIKEAQQDRKELNEAIKTFIAAASDFIDITNALFDKQILDEIESKND